MRKPHLDFLALAARELEGFGIGEGAHPVAHILVDIARDLAGRSRRAFGFRLADAAIFCTRAIGENPALIDDP